MSNDVTEADLLTAVMDEIEAGLARPIGPDEWTIADWMHRYNVTRPQAEYAMQDRIGAGIVERLPEKRIQQGHAAWAYRKTKPPA